MIVKAPELARALKAPAAVRCFLFYGPDEAGSRALAKRVGAASGESAEQIDLSVRTLRDDPARLADEAAAVSMFGGERYILVDGVNEDCVDAVAALLSANAAGNPVALVAGALKPTSALLKLVTSSASAVGFASYVPEARDAERLVVEIGREAGLSMAPEVARRIAEAAGGNRAVIAQELEKFSLYLGEESDVVTTAVIEAVGAGREEGDPSAMVDAVFGGRPGVLETELARLHSEGTEGITLMRAAMRRALMLARLRGRVERGEEPRQAADSLGKALFWKDKDEVIRQVSTWPAGRLAACVTALGKAERDLKRRGALGPLGADAALMAISRSAARRR